MATNDPPAKAQAACVLCLQPGGEVLRDDGFARVVLAGDADHPGFCRVILDAHVREMTDLPPAQRARLMEAVYAVEQALRELLSPDKVNLASFGNMVPHLHWHVIPRFADDPHFPDAVWAQRKPRPGRPLPAGFGRALRKRLEELLEPR
ncbi:MAG TPA: HIT family protein [Burkholderiales bacterium]|nr:HIT family protein [Burkholderiales bacterium]